MVCPVRAVTAKAAAAAAGSPLLPLPAQGTELLADHLPLPRGPRASPCSPGLCRGRGGETGGREEPLPGKQLPCLTDGVGEGREGCVCPRGGAKGIPPHLIFFLLG